MYMDNHYNNGIFKSFKLFELVNILNSERFKKMSIKCHGIVIK